LIKRFDLTLRRSTVPVPLDLLTLDTTQSYNLDTTLHISHITVHIHSIASLCPIKCRLASNRIYQSVTMTFPTPLVYSPM
jgi:hypothetical protein